MSNTKTTHTTISFAEKTGDEWRDQAAKARQSEQESYERSDTDGFMSQWASGLTSREYEMKAVIADNGGLSEFSALFDLEGNLIPAKYIETRYGWSWALLDSDEPTASFKGFFSPSRAQTDSYRIANDAKKGYYVGTVKAPANVKLFGESLVGVRPIIYRTDGGFSREVEIVDNGL